MPLDGAAPDTPAPDGGGPDGGTVPGGTVPGGTAPGGAAPGGTAPEGTEGLTYEQARDELAEVVHRLEAGGVPLEESLALWERGERLAAACQSMLDGARQRLEARRQQV